MLIIRFCPPMKVGLGLIWGGLVARGSRAPPEVVPRIRSSFYLWGSSYYGRHFRKGWHRESENPSSNVDRHQHIDS